MNFSIKRNNMLKGFLIAMLLLFGCSGNKQNIPDIELIGVMRDNGGELFMKIRITNWGRRTLYLIGQDYSSIAVYSMGNDNRWVKTYWGPDVIDDMQLKWDALAPQASCEQMLRFPTACQNSTWYMELFTFQRPEWKDMPDGPVLRSSIYLAHRSF